MVLVQPFRLSNLSDVTITSPDQEQALYYDGANWTNSTNRYVVICATKSADETIQSDSTLTDDADMTITLEINSSYLILVFFKCTSGATPDFQYACSIPTGVTGQANRSTWSGSATPAETNITTATNTPTAAGIRVCQDMAFLDTGATAGAITFQWAQGTLTASNTILHKGSCIVAIKLL